MAEQLYLIRHFEEMILQLKGESLLHGPAHASIGREGGAVATPVVSKPLEAVALAGPAGVRAGLVRLMMHSGDLRGAAE